MAAGQHTRTARLLGDAGHPGLLVSLATAAAASASLPATALYQHIYSEFVIGIILLGCMVLAGWPWLQQLVWPVLSEWSLPAASGHDAAGQPWQVEQAVWHAVLGPAHRHWLQHCRCAADADRPLATAPELVTGAGHAVPVSCRLIRHGVFRMKLQADTYQHLRNTHLE